MISAVLITLNEEKNIKQAISCLSFADEIIIVDCGSGDDTVAIARQLGAKVYFREFDNFANQKNWAVEKSEGDWILSVDADEVIPEELREEIKKAVGSKTYNGYLIPRRNFILGAEIKYSRWSPDKHVWLWKKSSGNWVGKVHEEIVVTGKTGELKNAKLHYSYKSVGEFLKANNQYSTLEAKQLMDKKQKFSLLNMIWQAKFEFILRFGYKKGFLDGWRGFTLAYLMGIYKLMVWIKLWELYNKKN